MMEEYADPSISSFDDELSDSAAEIILAVSLKEEIHDSVAEEEEEMVIRDEEELVEETVIEDEEEEVEEDDEEEEEEEEEFSFVLGGSDSAPITADDAFQNGQIRSFFPIFDQSLLYGGVSTPDRDDLPHLLPVNKVFIETEESTSPAAGNGKNTGEISGPYCTWTRKAVEATVSASPEVCKKSNSTGFSKLWRFHDLLHRSNSDGKDAYVFLNGSSASRSKAASEKRQAAVSSAAAVGGKKTKSKAKKGDKSAAVKAHEKYLRSKEEDRRRSYLPYRPELMGFFTNVHGGMTKNVHPF